MANVQVKRIYAQADQADGIRILVDRLWPRGVSKHDARLDYWLKEIAPQDQLRKDFHQKEVTYSEFKQKYKQQLNAGKQKEAMEQLKEIIAANQDITLLFAAKDEAKNNAQVLLELLE